VPEACILKSVERGFTYIELEVHPNNTAAIALKYCLGLVEEGLKRRARFLDGYYQDLLIMGSQSV